LNHEYIFTVKAVDLGGNLSAPSNEASANTYMAGLYYEHSTGGWTDLDQIDWSIAEYSGKVNNFTLSPRTQEDYFNFQFEGYLYINIPGTYQLRTTSDDGSRLALNNNVIVENDGLHGNVTITSSNQTLASGPHLINVKFFEYTGGQTLTVSYRGPDTGNNWTAIPDAALKSGNQSSLLTAATRKSTEDKAKAKKPRVLVHPNPLQSHQSIVVSVDNAENGVAQLMLMNLYGESFYQSTVDSAKLTEGMQILPAKGLRRGIYILTIRLGGNTMKERIIVRD